MSAVELAKAIERCSGLESLDPVTAFKEGWSAAWLPVVSADEALLRLERFATFIEGFRTQYIKTDGTEEFIHHDHGIRDCCKTIRIMRGNLQAQQLPIIDAARGLYEIYIANRHPAMNSITGWDNVSKGEQLHWVLQADRLRREALLDGIPL